MILDKKLLITDIKIIIIITTQVTVFYHFTQQKTLETCNISVAI